MSEERRDGPERRRRMGPLGESDDETRRMSQEESQGTTRRAPAEPDQGKTRRIPWPSGDSNQEFDTAAREREKPTRVIRPSIGDTAEAPAYPRAYFEAAEEREMRLRDMYGGVDWLASFLGFIFAAVAGAVFSSIAGLVLVPLGFSLRIGGNLGTAEITGLVVVAILVFLTYFFGGYVAGRLARFDGGMNGMMAFVWSAVVSFIVIAVGPFLPGGGFETLRNFVQSTVLPGFNNLMEMGIVGLGIVVGVIVVALLGGFAGGRLGSRYHSQIDRTT